MTQSTESLRQQRRVRELSAAVTRALTADPSIHIRQQHFFKGNHSLASYAPHLRLHPEEQLEFLRGVADSLAIRLQYSNAELHAQHLPTKPLARLVFDWLESLRTESLTPAHLPGVRSNLQKRFYYWSAGFHHAGHTQTALGILLYTVAQMCWSRLMGQPVFAETEDLIESTRASINADLGVALAGLRRYRHEQSHYIPYALTIAEVIAQSVEQALANKNKQETDHEEDSSQSAFALLLDIDTGQEGAIHTADSAPSEAFHALKERYAIFDTQHDTITYPARQVRPELLDSYREIINQRLAAQHLPFPLLVQRIRRALIRPWGQHWEWDQEEGLIDGRRLTQLVSSPMERRLFKRPQPLTHHQTSVSFLIDCSGSMKAHAETLTMMVDLLCKALERAGALTEILGFSTQTWNGGRPYRRWRATGRKPYPGRLNEVEHRIFKEAQSSWQQANRAIMALLKLDLYREGIDGEAVQWACERLLTQSSQRKLLYVISDGSPMDSATNLANDDFYIDNHLQQMLHHYQTLGIEICGIGIGLDLGQLYTHSLIADLQKGLDNHFVDDFIQSLKRQK